MRYNILFGGEAGQGPNILTHILGEALVNQGYYVFYARDYQSLIRRGHNFNVLTFSDKPINSNDGQIDILVALDENTKKIHKKDLIKKGIILDGKHENMYSAGRLFKILGLDFKILENKFKTLKRRFEENMKEAKEGYANAEKKFDLSPTSKNQNYFANGSQAVAQGAIKSGLDFYYAYPMTPATPVFIELAKQQTKNKFYTFELENEVAVINAAVGSSITGAKTMVGTSGGGFDLMTETFSLIGIANIPMVIYLAQRHGPATGAATYTGQEDLNTARHSGHGEFPKLVVAGGDPTELEELTSQAFYFSQKYKIPSIILSDKHLAESAYTSTTKAKITPSLKSTKLAKYNSKDTDKNQSATSRADMIKANVEKRLQKTIEIIKEAKKFNMYKVYGNKNSNNVIVSWGSPKGAILDAMKGITPCSSKMSDDLKKSSKGAILDATKDLDCKFVQILYIEPFPTEIKKELKGKNLILIENNATAQLGSLIAEKTGIFIENKNKILRYDGRPFLCDELKKEIVRRLG